MRWVTRRRIHVNRTATSWLIRRFLDPNGEILFVEPEDVAEVQRREEAVGFDAPGRKVSPPGRPGTLFLEQLVEERLGQDAALLRLARIVHGADFPEEPGSDPEAVGLWAISQGFTEVGRDDPDIVARASFLYDSLYAHLRRAGADGARG